MTKAEAVAPPRGGDSGLSIEPGGPPGRTWRKTHLAYGLLSVEVDLIPVIIEPDTHRSQFIAVKIVEEPATDTEPEKFRIEHHPIGTMPYDKTTGDPICEWDETAEPAPKLVPKPEYAIDEEGTSPILKGRLEKVPGGTDEEPTIESKFVPVTDEEIAELGIERGATEITKIIRLEELGDDARWLLTTKNYQIRATRKDQGKAKVPNVPGERLLANILVYLKNQNAVALVELALQDAQGKRFGYLDQFGYLRILAFTDYIRQPAKMPEVQVTERELELVEAAFSPILAREPLVFPDHRGRLFDELIKRKLEDPTMTTTVKETPAPLETEVDFLAALQAAADAAKDQ